jgi:signal transduction histidine kinase
MPNRPIDLPAEFDAGAFLSRQSHDLKTPLNHIVGFSRLVLKGQDGPLTDFQREDMTTVYNSSMRTLFLISHLIEAARISRGEKGLSLAEIEAAPFIEQVIATWKKNNPAREAQIESALSASSPTIVADEQQLRQLVASLMSVAVEYTQGPVRVMLTLALEPDWLVVTVQSVGKKSQNPSALDLELLGFISQACLEQHGGSFRVRQETDDGAVFCFALPRRAPA